MSDLNATHNLVHSNWETLDPTPNIHDLFGKFNYRFFDGKLSCVELEWSKKMYQCAGICYSKKTRSFMSCTIRLSEPLLKLRSRKELIETLLHEMIHAFNFIKGIHEGNGGHGPVFKSIMERINRIAGTNITVYHTFHDEVNLYKTHWWRCDGSCKDRSPYFGYVKRTCNRAPGKNDFWFAHHQQTCGGTFIKIKEPEPKKKGRKSNKENKAAPKTKKNKVTPISNYFDKTKGGGTMTKNPGSSTVVIRKPFETPNNTRITNLDGNLKNVKQFKDLDESEPEYKIPKQEIEVFKGSGFVLGGSSTGSEPASTRSRLLDKFDPPKPKPLPVELNNSLDSRKRKLSFEFDSDDIVQIDYDSSDDSDSFFAQIDFTQFDKWEQEGRQNAIKHEIDEDSDDIILIDDEYDVSLDILGDKSVCDELFSDSDPLLEEFQKSLNENKDDDLVACAMCSKQLKRSEMKSHYNDCGTKFAESSFKMLEIDYDLVDLDDVEDYQEIESHLTDPELSKSQPISQKHKFELEDDYEAYSMPSTSSAQPQLKKPKFELEDDYEPYSLPSTSSAQPKLKKPKFELEDDYEPYSLPSTSSAQPKLKKLEVEIITKEEMNMHLESKHKIEIKDEFLYQPSSSSGWAMPKPFKRESRYAEKMPVEYQVMKDCGYAEDVIEEYLKNFYDTEQETERDVAGGFCKCPICQQDVKLDAINQHIDDCSQY